VNAAPGTGDLREAAHRGIRPPADGLDPLLRGTLDRLEETAPRRWYPRRLFLVNYWLFDQETFELPHGRILLRGPNASGKSTVLASAITLVLDSHKRQEWMDTTGGRRSVSYLLIGEEGKEYFYESRRGYVALEFRNGRTGEIKTIGLGLYADRTRQTDAVDSWGFVIRDGRRLGEDLHLVDPEARTTPDRRALEEMIGAGGEIVEGVGDYEALVNRELFGWSDPDEYTHTLDMLREIRRPKLTKELDPAQVCERLPQSLPPLEPGVLETGAKIITNISEFRRQREELDAQIQAIAHCDDRLSLHLRHRAQRAAFDYREAYRALDRARAEHEEARQQLEEAEAALKAAGERIGAIEGRQSTIQERIRQIRGSDAFKGEEALRQAEVELDEARSENTIAAGELDRARTHLEDARQKLAERREAWNVERGELLGRLDRLHQQADSALWDIADEQARAARAALEDVSLEEGNLADVPAALAPAALRQHGTDRKERLGEVVARMEEVRVAEATVDEAVTRLDEADRVFREADAAREAAHQRFEQARSGLVSAVERWAEDLTDVPGLDAALEASIGYLEAAAGDDDPARGLGPIHTAVRARQAEIDEHLRGLGEERARAAARASDLRGDLEDWQGRTEATPPRDERTTRARQALEEAGVRCAPLYEVVEPRQDLPADEAATLERALEQAGLLDALVVDAAEAGRVEALLAADGLEDRWIAGGAGPALGGTLSELLTPVGGTPFAASARRALEAFAIESLGHGARLGRDGRWQLGPLAGRAWAEEAEARYLGAESRRRERERQIRRLETQLGVAEAALCGLESRIEAGRDERRVLIEALEALTNLPPLGRWRQAAAALLAAQEGLEQRRLDVGKADAALKVRKQELQDARGLVLSATSAIPEVRGASLDRVRVLLGGVDVLVEQFEETARAADRLGTSRRHVADQVDQVDHDEETVATREAAVSAAERRIRKLESRVQTQREILEGTAADLEALRREVGELEAEQATLGKELNRLHERRGHYRGEKGRAEAAQTKAERQVSAAHARALEDVGLFRQRLDAYPSLAEVRALCEEDEGGPRRAAESLLEDDEGDPTDYQRRLDKRVRDSGTEVDNAVRQHDSTLASYRDSRDEDGVLRFTYEGEPVLPCVLRDKLTRQGELIDAQVEDSEHELFENIILTHVTAELKKKIRFMEEWAREVNQMLARHPLQHSEVFSLEWRARAAGEYEDTGPAEIARIVERDAALFTAEQRQAIIDFVTRRVQGLSTLALDDERDINYEEALKEALDYRKWFEFRMYSEKPGQKRVCLNTRTHDTRSGAEKSLAVLVPFLMALSARFDHAHRDAPQLIGLDEALAGVDAGNAAQIYHLLVDLGFSWIMTSEQLWTVSDAIPACSIYEIRRKENLVCPILKIWDAESGRTVEAGDPGLAADDQGELSARAGA